MTDAPPFNPYQAVGRFEAFTVVDGNVVKVLLINCYAGVGRRDHLQVCHPVSRQRIPGEFVSMKAFNERYGLTKEDAIKKATRVELEFLLEQTKARLARTMQLVALRKLLKGEPGPPVDPLACLKRKVETNASFALFMENRLLGEFPRYSQGQREREERRADALEKINELTPEQAMEILVEVFGTAAPA